VGTRSRVAGHSARANPPFQMGSNPERLAAPLRRYLAALAIRSARVAEVPLSVYCARVEAALRSVRRERP
jgi:hypothetical protein